MSAEFEKNVYRKFNDFDNKLETFEKNVYRKFDSIDKNFKELKQDTYKKFDSIDKKFENIDRKFDSIDKKFESIDRKFDSIDKKFESIDEFQKEANNKFDKIFHVLDVIRESQILVEHQVMVKIPALFDGYAMHQQKQEILENNINSLDRKVEDHDIRLSILEQQSV